MVLAIRKMEIGHLLLPKSARHMSAKSGLWETAADAAHLHLLLPVHLLLLRAGKPLLPAPATLRANIACNPTLGTSLQMLRKEPSLRGALRNTDKT